MVLFSFVCVLIYSYRFLCPICNPDPKPPKKEFPLKTSWATKSYKNVFLRKKCCGWKWEMSYNLVEWTAAMGESQNWNCMRNVLKMNYMIKKYSGRVTDFYSNKRDNDRFKMKHPKNTFVTVFCDKRKKCMWILNTKAASDSVLEVTFRNNIVNTAPATTTAPPTNDNSSNNHWN